MENEKYILELTKIVYKLTLLFPKKEPLRYKMRELADDILANSSSFFLGSNNNKKSTIVANLYQLLEVMDGFFEVAKAQNWVKQEELLEIQKGYDNLKREVQTGQNKNNLNLQNPQPPKASAEAGPPQTQFNRRTAERSEGRSQMVSPSSPTSPLGALSEMSGAQRTMPERQEKILAFLREQGRAQVWQLKEILPEVTKRTLRRDFEALLKQGLIERIGERNSTFYQIKTA